MNDYKIIVRTSQWASGGDRVDIELTPEQSAQVEEIVKLSKLTHGTTSHVHCRLGIVEFTW